MQRLAILARSAFSVAPGEKAVVYIVCAVLIATGFSLIGAAAYHELARVAGAQTARLVLGLLALSAALIVWAVGRSREKRRQQLAAMAREQLTRELSGLRPGRPGIAVAAAAFAAAFLAGRNR